MVDRIGLHIMEPLNVAQEVGTSIALEEAVSKQVTDKHQIATMMAQNTYQAFILRCNFYQMEIQMGAVYHIHFLIIVDLSILPMDPYSLFKHCMDLNIMVHRCQDQ